MIYISDVDRDLIKIKMRRLPGFLREPYIPVLFFETLGTLILAYGTCVSLEIHPINKHIPNPTSNFLISCFFYFALSVAAPFSGGKLNPAISMVVQRVDPNSFLGFQVIGQVIGAIAGTGIAYLSFEVIPMPYTEHESFVSCLLDLVGEAFGTFLFVFFLLYVTRTRYMAGQYFRYLVLAVMLFAGRMMTLRKQCLNPAFAIAFQLFTAIRKGDFLLFLPYALPMIFGPILGAFIGYYFFIGFYWPLREGLEDQKVKAYQELEEEPEKNTSSQ